jgi:multidrug resistance efflux pump
MKIQKEFKRPALRTNRRHIVKQLLNGWPWIAWMVAAILVVVLLPGGIHRVRFFGEAECIYEYVAPLEDGRLQSLLVQVGEPVRAGQLLGRLDNASLATDLLMDEVSLMKSRDKVHSIRSDLGNLKLAPAKTAADLQALESRWKRTQDLLSKNLLLEQDVEDLGPEIAAKKQVLALYPGLIAELEQRVQAAENDVNTFSSDELKKLKNAQCELRAQTAGVVAEIVHAPGDVVESGDPVLRISETATSRVIAFVPEEKRTQISAGDKCLVISAADGATYHGIVKTVTADIRKLPVFTGFGDQILRGRRMMIELNDGSSLVPGERVVIVPEVSLFDQWFGRN